VTLVNEAFTMLLVDVKDVFSCDKLVATLVKDVFTVVFSCSKLFVTLVKEVFTDVFSCDKLVATLMNDAFTMLLVDVKEVFS
jgi:hypothetical protein